MRLRVLCPQEYEGMEMKAVPCSRCRVGWDHSAQRCSVTTGVEHLPLVLPSEVPACPMATQCQHQIQLREPCVVRARGLVCESALAWAGEPEPWDHPLSFHAGTVITEEELRMSLNEDTNVYEHPELADEEPVDPKLIVRRTNVRDLNDLYAALDAEGGLPSGCGEG